MDPMSRPGVLLPLVDYNARHGAPPPRPVDYVASKGVGDKPAFSPKARIWYSRGTF